MQQGQVEDEEEAFAMKRTRIRLGRFTRKHFYVGVEMLYKEKMGNGLYVCRICGAV